MLSILPLGVIQHQEPFHAGKGSIEGVAAKLEHSSDANCSQSHPGLAPVLPCLHCELSALFAHDLKTQTHRLISGADLHEIVVAT